MLAEVQVRFSLNPCQLDVLKSFDRYSFFEMTKIQLSTLRSKKRNIEKRKGTKHHY
jgi:hypothetical protein